jgi:hypothetical protein
MVRPSYSGFDASFAEGLITTLAGFVTPLRGTESGHWRPMADLGAPYGGVIGDASLFYSSAQYPGESLLIAEREGSAPGNERNILKWYQAIRGQHRIRLDSGTGPIEVHPARVVLVLCFARPDPSKWSESDFQKTAGFCSILAELVGRDLRVHTPRFEVHTDLRSYAASDWVACGRDFATSCRPWL